jgi:hypothetical protein
VQESGAACKQNTSTSAVMGIPSIYGCLENGHDRAADPHKLGSTD